MPNIILKDVYVRYKIKRKEFVLAVEKADVVFDSNKINVIIGQSGSGKTSILRAIAGLIPLEQGEIYFDDILINDFATKDRNVSYVSQLIGLYPTKTVFGNIAFPLRVAHASGEEIRKRVFEVASMLHIESCLSRKPKDLSIGQCQRVAIARAMVKMSNVYMFDEPFSNLDSQLSQELTREIKDILHNSGYTAIFISHDIKEAFLLADKIHFMHEGQFIYSGSAQELLKTNDERIKVLIKEASR